jgi:hypothetical protein
MIGIDFAPYLAEAQRPIPADQLLPLKAIVVSAHLTLEADPDMSGDESAAELLHIEAERTHSTTGRFAGSLRADYGWFARADTGNLGDIPVGLTDTPVNAFACAPVRLDPCITVADTTMIVPSGTMAAGPILNPVSPLVVSAPWGRGGRYAQAVADIAPTLGGAIVLGLLRDVLRWSSPATREAARSERRGRQAVHEALDRQEDPAGMAGAGGLRVGRDFLDPLRTAADRESRETRALLACVFR